jgi:hypothetical protein
MAGHLVAPRPVRLGTGTSVNLPFFLSNALAAPEPSPVGSSTRASPQIPQASKSAKVAPQIAIPAPSRDEMSIEDLAANIRLDDEPLCANSGVQPLDRGTSSPRALDKHASVPVSRWMAEDVAVPPPRYECSPTAWH